MADSGTLKRAGRPPIAEEARLVQVPMRLEAVVFEEVCRKAEFAKVSASAELRRLIKKALMSERDLRIH